MCGLLYRKRSNQNLSLYIVKAPWKKKSFKSFEILREEPSVDYFFYYVFYILLFNFEYKRKKVFINREVFIVKSNFNQKSQLLQISVAQFVNVL